MIRPAAACLLCTVLLSSPVSARQETAGPIGELSSAPPPWELPVLEGQLGKRPLTQEDIRLTCDFKFTSFHSFAIAVGMRDFGIDFVDGFHAVPLPAEPG
ncbi:hypothetical protein [Magnetospirillum sp. ME-1]|uniref:hypothetical protein n=1 Tax=Magnetospirillum sp. ME-1 TaxID=1639348 RepID=UPI0011AE5EAB|nr:hypothetical protein [Magnetospirillum sp. ME-1]